MKKILKYALFVSLLASQQVHAQQVENPTEITKISHNWICQATFPSFGGTSHIISKSQFSDKGLFTQEIQLDHTAADGEITHYKVTGSGSWHYEPSQKQFFQTLNTSHVTFESKNLTTSLIGEKIQKNYTLSIGKPQSSYVVRLNDKEWLSVINTNAEPVSVECTR